MGDEMGMCREVLGMAVLKNEEATRREERPRSIFTSRGEERIAIGFFICRKALSLMGGAGRGAKDEVRELFQLGKGVRRVGKDEVVSARSLAKEAENIGAKERDVIVGTKGVYELADEGDMLRRELYSSNMCAAPRKQFEGDAACAGKEIKGNGSFALNALNALALKVDV